MVSTFPTLKLLLEGGAATAAFNTGRATKADIETALKFVEKHTGIPYQQLVDNLLGSTSHTLLGKKKDSGDLDIAIEDGRYDRKQLADAMQKATGMDKVKVTGGNTYSFAVPVGEDKRVQVDFMFVPSEKWARFGYHSAVDSKHKGAVRNILIDHLIKRIFEEGKDLSVKENGEEVVRVRRAFKRGEGLERLFRLAPMRKDGKGRAALRPATPEEVEAELKRLNHPGKFEKSSDPIMDPDKAAEFLFGKGVKAKDMMSAEQVIKLISKRPDHADIFREAAEDLEKNGLEVPAELIT